MATVNQEFQSAPMGRRVAGAMLFALVALIAGSAASIYVSLTRMPAPAPAATRVIALLAPFVGLLVGLPFFFYQRSRIVRFQIVENCLVLGAKRFPLEGLVGAVRDPEILRWAFRSGRNGAMGAIRGYYRSRRVGKFYAFMTGTEKAVVLRWPDHTVAVSPEDPEFFIMCVRSAAGLR